MKVGTNKVFYCEQTLDQTLRGGGKLRTFVQHVEDMKRIGRFRGSVLGPIGAEVSILPGCPSHAASALENCVPNRVWGAFVVEHTEDQRLIRECAATSLSCFQTWFFEAVAGVTRHPPTWVHGRILKRS